MTITMTRRAALAGSAALPAIAVPAMAARPMNGTDRAWRELVAAETEKNERNAQFDAAWNAWRPNGYEAETAELPALHGDAARATRRAKPAHVVQTEREAEAASERFDAADSALLAAPVLTVEDAARKLQHALDYYIDADDWAGKLVASTLAGLRAIA